MATATVFPGPVPEEALAYLRAKKLKPSFDYKEVWAEEHAAAFTVAKSAGFDILGDVRAAVDQALAQGIPFEQFRKTITPTLQAKGWWGREDVVDPLTGEVRSAQLGSPRRLAAIYNTNLRTARAAGQWQRIQRTKRALPYLIYELGPARHHREEHVGWAGICLPVDDPWWKTHFTPNGWGCHCWTRQISKVEFESLKTSGVRIQVQEVGEDGVPTGRLVDRRVPLRTQSPPIRRREWINKRTGEVLQVPEGIDPGWDYNPGMAPRLGKAAEQAGDKLVAVPQPDGAAAVRSLVQSPAFPAWLANPSGSYPVAMLPEAEAARIGGQRAGAVRFSAATATKQQDHHSEIEPSEYLMVQTAIDQGRSVVDRRSLIYILEDERYVSVIKATRTGQSYFLTSFRRLPSAEAKKDEKVARLLRKGTEVKR